MKSYSTQYKTILIHEDLKMLNNEGMRIKNFFSCEFIIAYV